MLYPIMHCAWFELVFLFLKENRLCEANIKVCLQIFYLVNISSGLGRLLPFTKIKTIKTFLLTEIKFNYLFQLKKI